MGAWGAGADRLFCEMDFCGRRPYVEAADGSILCHVCDSTILNECLGDCVQILLCCPPARQSSKPLQDFWQNPDLAKLCMEFLHGDGWERQCFCTRCKHSWLNAGWVCPVDHRWEFYYRALDGIYYYEYSTAQLQYVDWDEAVRCLHEMYTDEIPWDNRALKEFTRLSACTWRAELREMYPDDPDEDNTDELPNNNNDPWW